MSSANTAYEIGSNIGVFVWSAVYLTVFIKQIQRFKIPNRSKFASLGLMLWSVAALIILIGGWIRDTQIEFQSIATFNIVLCLVWFAIQVSSFTTAGIGFYETRIAKERKEGFNLVVWSMVLGLLFSGLIGFGAYRTIATIVRSEGSGKLTQISPTDSNSKQVSQGLSKDGFALYERVDENFGLRLKDSDWIELDPSQMNEDVTLLFRNRKMDLNFMIIAEPLGLDFENLSMFEQFAESHLKSALTEVETNPFEDSVVGERPLRTMLATGKIGAIEVSYKFYMFQEQGVLYQLIFYTGGRNSLKSKAKQIEGYVDSFYILDKDFYPGAGSGDTITALAYEPAGISMKLSGPGWLEWDAMAEDAPEFEMGALSIKGIAVGSMVTWHIKPDENLKVIASSFLHALDMNYNSITSENISSCEMDGHEGLEVLFKREYEEGYYKYSLRVTRINDVAIAAVGWWQLDEDATLVLSSLNNMRIDVDAINDAVEMIPRRVSAQSSLLNAAGLAHYAESRYGAAMDYFMQAYQVNPKMTLALDNVALAALNLGAYSDAIEFIEPELSQHKHSDSLKVNFGRMLVYEGRIDEGYTFFSEVFASGHSDDDVLLDCLNILIDAEEYAKAIELNEIVLKKTPSMKIASWLATVTRLSGDYEAAEAVMTAIIAEYGMTPMITEESVVLKQAQEDHQAALKILDEWEAKDGPSATTTQLRVLSLMDLNWLIEAKKVVEAGIDSYPGDAVLMDYERWILSRVGEDDLTLVREEIEPLQAPEVIQTLLEAAAAREEPEAWLDKSSVYEYVVTAYEFDPEAPFRATTTRRVRINDRMGMEDFSTLNFEFDRGYEKMYVNFIRVLDAAGQVVWEQERDSFYISENSDENMASDEVTLYAPVASLAPNSILEWQVSWESEAVEDEFPLKRHIFSSGYAMKERIVYLTGSTDSVLAHVKDVLPVGNIEPGLIGWRQQNLEAYQAEKNTPEFTTFLPHVLLSARGKDWGILSSEYYTKIEEYLAVEGSISELALKQDLEGLSSAEKVSKLVRLIQGQVVYKALEFGSRGRIPEHASTTWKNRYGDCKDQTVLLHQLLAAVGIESHPLLISTSQDLVREMPSMDQFNHMILYVPKLEKPFVDPVDTNFDINYGPPSGLGGRSGLLVKATDSEILELPGYPFALGTPVAKIEANFGEDLDGGGFTVMETLELNGYYAMWMRNRFLDLDKDRYNSEIKDYVSRYLPNNAKFKSVGLFNLNAIKQPLLIKVEYALGEDALTATGVEIRPLWEQYYLDLKPQSERVNPYRLSYPFTLSSSVVVDPKHFSLQFVHPEYLAPALLQSERQTDAAEGEDGRLKTTVRIGWPSLVIEREQYDGFYSSIEKSNQAFVVLIKKNGD